MTPHLDSKRLPLNEQVITYYQSGVTTGLWGRGEYVQTFHPDGVCDNNSCKYPDEHISFDGQIFYLKLSKRRK
jgi:hypothetical protein